MAYLELFGAKALSARVHVPGNGIWIAEVELDSDAEVKAEKFAATVKVGETTFVGTYDPEHSGVFGFKRRAQVVGGANGWHARVPCHQFHNDAGIKVSNIVRHAASAVGERFEIAADLDTRIGVDWDRFPGPASSTLYDLHLPWWVDYAGTTQVRPRQMSEAKDYDLLDFSPGQRVAELGVFDPKTVLVGAVLTSTRLSSPFTIRSLEISVDADRARVYAWGT